MNWTTVWSSNKFSARLGRLALTPASWIYAAGWQSYLGAYRMGLLKAYRLHQPVICIGNLTVGGSGKTPVTIHVAKVLADLGCQVVLSTNGYGSPAFKMARLAPDGPLDPLKWGDESALIREALPGMPLVVGKRRAEVARICGKEYPDAVMLLDDGFQHLPLSISTSILLEERRRKGANRMCLPAGPYREPRRNADRADLRLPGHFHVEYSDMRYEDQDGKPVHLTSAYLLCALGTPRRLAARIEHSGISLDGKRFLPDHDSLQEGNLFNGIDPDEPVIVTTKDWVKLRLRPDIGERNIVIVRRDARIEPEGEFRSWIEQRLNEFTP
jgi:tetraacyldisaccharide 4'-kinase